MIVVLCSVLLIWYCDRRRCEKYSESDVRRRLNFSVISTVVSVVHNIHSLYKMVIEHYTKSTNKNAICLDIIYCECVPSGWYMYGLWMCCCFLFKYIQWGMWQVVADWIYFEVKLISVNNLVALPRIFTTENDIYDASGCQLFYAI